MRYLFYLIRLQSPVYFLPLQPILIWTSHIWRAQRPHVVCGYWIGQCRVWGFCSGSAPAVSLSWSEESREPKAHAPLELIPPVSRPDSKYTGPQNTLNISPKLMLLGILLQVHSPGRCSGAYPLPWMATGWLWLEDALAVTWMFLGMNPLLWGMEAEVGREGAERPWCRPPDVGGPSLPGGRGRKAGVPSASSFSLHT